MELTIDQALHQGVAAHREGKLQHAERLYSAILQAQPSHPDANHNLGLLTVAVGRPLDAIPLFKRALEANPQIEQFWLSYIDALITLEEFEEAKRVLVEGEKAGVSPEKLDFLHQQIPESPPSKKSRKAKARNSSPKTELPQDQLNHLLEHYQAGRLEEAEALATLLTQQFPKHPFGWKVLGAVFKQTGRLNESLLPMQKSLELSPKDAEAHSNLGVTLKELGRLDDAEVSYRKAIALKPDLAEAHSNLGNTLQELRRLDDAEVSYRKAIALKPDLTEAHSNLGNTLRQLGRLDDAEVSCRKAIALKPEYAEAHSNLGVTLKELRRLDDAEESYRKAIALKPDYAEAHSNLGVTLQELGRLDDAEDSYRKAIVLKPDYAEAHYNLGVTLQELGRLDDAEVGYRKAIALKPDLAEAHLNLATMKKFSSEDEQFVQMQLLYRDPALSEQSRCQIYFALAKASEDLKDFATAFECYAEANALRKKQLGYDKAQDTKLFQTLKAKHPLVRAHSSEPEMNNAELTPIFIVGMPRSGTTLVEQIISSHPLVTGAGELNYASQFGSALAVGQGPINAEALKTFREQYLHALKRRSEGNAVITDKMPHNFRFLGLIAATILQAKIIHVKRDPAAVCWANYTQYFVKDSLGYCYDLDDVLHYHELYQDLMKYWHQALPNRIYDLDYEALTECQEQETRNLIGYLGLEWNDACLSPQDNTRAVATASNAQVRQKVYQGSSHKWKRYLPFLNGALDHLSIGN